MYYNNYVKKERFKMKKLIKKKYILRLRLDKYEADYEDDYNFKTLACCGAEYDYASAKDLLKVCYDRYIKKHKIINGDVIGEIEEIDKYYNDENNCLTIELVMSEWWNMKTGKFVIRTIRKENNKREWEL